MLQVALCPPISAGWKIFLDRRVAANSRHSYVTLLLLSHVLLASEVEERTLGVTMGICMRCVCFNQWVLYGKYGCL